ncbi:hypothetical protein SB85_00550 [Xanthomonas sacchari]|nr:hypothetical protein SB85_00550 [Xanthomonas sacchari]
MRSASTERRRRLPQWARLRQGVCVTLACVAVALAPSWDARGAPPSSQARLHASAGPSDQKAMEALVELLR